MIGVSKTFGGSSILSSPAPRRVRNALFTSFSGFFIFAGKSKGIKKVSNQIERGESFWIFRPIPEKNKEIMRKILKKYKKYKGNIKQNLVPD